MSFAKKAFSLFQIDAILFFTSIITGAIIARELGPDLRGLYAILLLIPSYAEAFGRIKFDVASVYFLGKRKIVLGEMIFLLNALAILTSAILICFFIWQYDWIYAQLYQNTTIDMHLLTFTILGIPSLAFYFDKTGDLERRQTLKLSLQNGRMQFLKHIHVISDENELIPAINKLFNNEIVRSNQTHATCQEWDYESILKRSFSI